MNVFQKVVQDELKPYFQLGNPSVDKAHFDARMTAMRFVTGGKGFRQDAKEPAVRAFDGTTRGQRKRAIYAGMIQKIADMRQAAKDATAAKLKKLRWRKADIETVLEGMPS